MEQEIVGQLVLAAFLGALIGSEREYRRKGAGLRTCSLVSLGTCLFSIISLELFKLFYQQSGVNFDPSRIIQAIAIGIGFIGAGVIFQQPSGVIGLTTAAALWTTAAIGLAIGVKLYFLATLATFLVIFILFALGWVEEKIFKGDKRLVDSER